MNVHQNARSTPASRSLMVHRVIEERQPVTTVAAGFGVSTTTVYKWLRRWRTGGETGLRDRSSAPLRRHATPPGRVARIEALRRRRMTAPRIAFVLGMPLSTVGAVLRRIGLNRLSRLDPKEPAQRYERARPGELIHLDTKKLGRIKGLGHRVTGRAPGRVNRHLGIGWEHLHVAIDDCSRLAYIEILPDDHGPTCAGFLERACTWFARCGAPVSCVMTDNAFAYSRSKAFKATLAAIGARHITTKPYTPRTNGKAERFIQTCLREWLYAKPYTSSQRRARDRLPWLHWYNQHRPHTGINASTPAEKLNNLLGNDS
jgi:transposase InsO family protein